MSARVHIAIVSNNSWLMKKIVVKQILKIKQIKKNYTLSDILRAFYTYIKKINKNMFGRAI